PMHDTSDRYVIIFNGEILNYKQLKAELIEAFGISFNTESDTEVLLNAYIHWGEGCLSKLSGFFAFVIYDKEKHDLFVARDRLGVKPLLYYIDEDKFVFASEMKSVLAYNVPKEIDWASVRQYLTLGYIPEPDSIFQTIKKVPAGTYMRISKERIEQKKYYQIPEKPIQNHTIEFQEAVATVRTIVDQSIQDRLVSDVPVGAFLSGGVDSSIVVASASQHTKNLHTFSIGYHDAAYYDETKDAELVAKTFGTSHTTYKLTKNDLIDHLFYCLDSIDEPFGDTSTLPLFLLSKKVSSKVKVVLSGDGADELFGGYNKHKAEWLVKHPDWKLMLAKVMAPVTKNFTGSREGAFGDTIRKMNKLTEGMKLSDSERYYAWCSLVNDRTLNDFLTIGNKGEEEYNKRRAHSLRRFNHKKYDFNTVLNTDLELVLGSDMLHKVDSMSMASGLEVREPLIDYRLVDYVTALPAEYKRNAKTGKDVLKQAFKEELPKEILNKPKHGFDVPLMDLFSKELKSWILDELFTEEFVKDQGVFRWDYILNIRNVISKSGNYDEAQLWSIIVFQYWWKKFMK
ncbi:MAG: asparagine synthase (glutamine-hydrolyzing), partial [Cytophagales bacterium]|nr:asparagine synthase (glutamine-hydrolyzing) [Cytophaga sp.]